ncbi:MAG: ketol-acid reductoisomerase [Tropheryma whipplei]|uniref:Ketol-acid reductoisomerase (NADP(+)) n=1 Tax=Tropheryma whipplei (strain TW08/27) TaxID=218496 RepID=ILVC_TROW8|nr:ketol-acid reductoisomerase [Tropheryma whipplei]Q83HI9.1 RecName: Full=Ketol-acid reductoisomerase (NADP(+)); Short=KARI; AltName: Full=Acetohydroxy-acid isomeroreductase; Short=AHIR; AltName: Full=Alpha-keto-beta-hydroxylacyl reductoisomerase; AltName: Full=Ketol-acid reductoisomerase type 1; AltName: Full=Ketol-acid reductoisomerase type I [Tropheryma whipplei TW08/27]MCO8183036.1 ketol-acid reductoisomerase [Tropheryma whipplei]MCO8190620.1 ketol-acid reductoisomerase [Tropheryma whipplei
MSEIGTRVYTECDADLSLIQNVLVAVIGYGSQGHAQALNLRDSGVNVVIGLKENSASRKSAQDSGFEVLLPQEAAKKAQLIALLVPDPAQRDVYESAIKHNLSEGDALLFSHGFNIRYGYITPPDGVDVLMVAPKGPGHMVRREYLDNRGTPAVFAIEKDASGRCFDLALSYAKGIGALRAGAIQTTFTEETETDLFGEQAVLCGGLEQLIQYGYETLVEAGYQPEVAYFEVLHELKLIIDLIVEGGLSKSRWSISDTAEYGSYVSGPRVIDKHVKENMKKILGEIRSGEFANRFIKDQDSGANEFTQLREIAARHPIEEVGARLRALFSWSK